MSPFTACPLAAVTASVSPGCMDRTLPSGSGAGSAAEAGHRPCLQNNHLPHAAGGASLRDTPHRSGGLGRGWRTPRCCGYDAPPQAVPVPPCGHPGDAARFKWLTPHQVSAGTRKVRAPSDCGSRCWSRPRACRALSWAPTCSAWPTCGPQRASLERDGRWDHVSPTTVFAHACRRSGGCGGGLRAGPDLAQVPGSADSLADVPTTP